MRHRKFTFKIGRTSAHRRAMLSNAVCSLIMAERIETTVAKAKQIRRLAEKMITLAKRGTLHARRRAIAILRQPDVVAYLFGDLVGRFENRNGGYTRIVRLGKRVGDAAEVCILEFVEAATADDAGETDEAGSSEDAETAAQKAE